MLTLQKVVRHVLTFPGPWGNLSDSEIDSIINQLDISSQKNVPKKNVTLASQRSFFLSIHSHRGKYTINYSDMGAYLKPVYDFFVRSGEISVVASPELSSWDVGSSS